MTEENSINQIAIALTWCLGWREIEKLITQSQNDKIPIINEIRTSLINKNNIPKEIEKYHQQVEKLLSIPQDYFPQNINELKSEYTELWNESTSIGLVYGGATKIKQYVFESSKLPEIRGASAILDRINLVDLPGFFGKKNNYNETKKLERYKSAEKWLDKNFPNLKYALIPELIIYSTGGNILAFCPNPFVDDLANAIERRYTEETLTANSCAVGDTFRLLEIRFGLLKDNITETKWLDWYLENKNNYLVEAYFGKPQEGEAYEELFKNRKSFNELAGKLATSFNQRRSGNETVDRPSRRYLPIFETHPYLQRDTHDSRSSITEVALPNNPQLSDSLARKRIAGQRTKAEDYRGQKWWKPNSVWAWEDGDTKKLWRSGILKSWIFKYKQFLNSLKKSNLLEKQLFYKYYDGLSTSTQKVTEARSLKEIGNASNSFVGYIYADGNNMG